jgi:hypothetical protein
VLSIKRSTVSCKGPRSVFPSWHLRVHVVFPSKGAHVFPSARFFPSARLFPSMPSIHAYQAISGYSTVMGEKYEKARNRLRKWWETRWGGGRYYCSATVRYYNNHNPIMIGLLFGNYSPILTWWSVKLCITWHTTPPAPFFHPSQKQSSWVHQFIKKINILARNELRHSERRKSVD